jgi:cyclophilin family peptidyl-prolyl cis-trans isomerase
MPDIILRRQPCSHHTRRNQVRTDRRNNLRTVCLAFATLFTLLPLACSEPEPHPGLTDPSLAAETAPATFRVQLETTKGNAVFEDISFHRVLENFVAQFGIHGKPPVQRKWQKARIRDEPRVESNVRGTLVFAQRAEPHSRTTQLFVNLQDNTIIDPKKFVPIGRVVSGMDVFDKLYRTDQGGRSSPKPSEQRISILGNAHLQEAFPELDYILRAKLLD